MPTNAERHLQIENLHKQLHIDLMNLEKKFKDDRIALQKKCNADVANLEREIKECRAQEIRSAQEQIWKVIESAGLDLPTIIASLPKERSPMKPSTVLHHGPDGKSWNGRGRVPRWFREQRSSNAAGQVQHV
jgi:DNA-binding protein H-NS